jgi:diguanylate cyclase (GGDEF)-like protein
VTVESVADAVSEPRVLDALPWPLAVIDGDGIVRYVNRAWPSAADPVGLRFDVAVGERTTVPPSAAVAITNAIAAALDGRAGDAVVEFAETGDPPAHWLRLRCGPIEGGGAFVMVEDVTAQRRRELELALRADHDPLTGLANRSRFLTEGRRMLAVAERQAWGMALLFIDLDAFKAINDGAGHTFGDAVLQQVASRLQSCTRAGDLLARVGGDEFVALLNGVDTPTSVALAQRYRSALANPPIVPGSSYTVSASVGIAIFPDAATTLDALVRLADAAMYRAKASGAGIGLADSSAAPD